MIRFILIISMIFNILSLGYSQIQTTNKFVADIVSPIQADSVEGSTLEKLGITPKYCTYKRKNRPDTLRMYLIFYEKYNSFINDADEEYLLGFAFYLKEESIRLKGKMKAEKDTVLGKYRKLPSRSHLNLINYENEVKAIEEKYKPEIEKLHSKAVEYFFHYRNLRQVQGPLGFKRDPALRTSLFYENNILNRKDKFLNSFALSFGSDGKISSSSELYKDYWGPFRISIGTLIATNAGTETDSAGIKVIDKSERKEESVQRIVGGGGNFIGTLSYPLFLFRTTNNYLSILVTANSRHSVDVPVLATSTSDYNYNANHYIDQALVVSGFEGNIALYITNRFGHLLGNTSFYNYLDISKGNKIRDNGMFAHQFQLGVSFADILRITYTVNYGHPFIVNAFSNNISFTILTQ